MGLFLIESSDRTSVKRGRGKKQAVYQAIKAEKFESFNSTVLGLGDISRRAERIEAVCAIFDLQGFTNCCNQADAKLVVPVFLAKFLDWFYTQIKEQSAAPKVKGAYPIFWDPPFYSKFMGDGILLLWNAEKMVADAKNNIIVSCYTICLKYYTAFYNYIKHDVAYFPPQLRCGLATGDVYSIGDGSDFVGACINTAARLQKLVLRSLS